MERETSQLQSISEKPAWPGIRLMISETEIFILLEQGTLSLSREIYIQTTCPKHIFHVFFYLNWICLTS